MQQRFVGIERQLCQTLDRWFTRDHNVTVSLLKQLRQDLGGVLALILSILRFIVQLVDKFGDDGDLTLFNRGCKLFAEVAFFNRHEFDEDFSDGALINVLNEKVKRLVRGVEQVVHDLVLLAIDQQDQKLAEVPSEYGVHWSLTSHKLEKSV